MKRIHDWRLILFEPGDELADGGLVAAVGEDAEGFFVDVEARP